MLPHLNCGLKPPTLKGSEKNDTSIISSQHVLWNVCPAWSPDPCTVGLTPLLPFMTPILFCKVGSALGIFSDPFFYASSKHLLSSCTADAIAGIGARVGD